MKKIIIAVITLLIIIHIPVWAEVIILKNGKVFEGEVVKEDDDKIELKTEYGVLTISKSDIKQVAKDVKELLEPGDELWQKAKACYEQALELRDDPMAKNKELLKGKNLLYQAHQLYDEIRQMFPQEEYDWIDEKKKEMLELFKEFRCARVRVSEADRKRAAYQKKLAELKDDDAEGHYQLALWCEKEGLKEQMLEELEKVIKIDPDHALAREKLGYIKKEDKWVRKEEPPDEKPEPSVEKPEPPPPPPPKPLTFEELIELLKSDVVEEKLKAIKKLTESLQDKAIQPLIDEFVKTNQDPEVYESIKSVLPGFNPKKVASSMKRIVATRMTIISKRVRRDALAILCQVDNKEYVKLLVKRLLDKAKFLARGKFKSDEERIQTYDELKGIRSLIARSPGNEAAIPLVSKYFRPSTTPAIRKTVIGLMKDIGTEKAAEALIGQLGGGASVKDNQSVAKAIMDIGLPTVFMPLVKGLGNERQKNWAQGILYALTEQPFGYDKEKWLEWWAENKDNYPRGD